MTWRQTVQTVGHRPCFAVRNHGELRVAKGEPMPTGEVHIAGTLHLDGSDTVAALKVV